MFVCVCVCVPTASQFTNSLVVLITPSNLILDGMRYYHFVYTFHHVVLDTVLYASIDVFLFLVFFLLVDGDGCVCFHMVLCILHRFNRL